MKVEMLAIPDVRLLTPVRHGDARGHFCETYSTRAMADALIDAAFVQDNQSLSFEAGVVRGLHFQTPPHAQGKLVRVLRGAIRDVVVDIRAGSPTYGQHVAVDLSADNGAQLWVPPDFAHGFCTTEPNTEVFYKVTAFYAPDHDKGLLWNDPALAIDWPIADGAAILSEKDKHHPTLENIESAFVY